MARTQSATTLTIFLFLGLSVKDHPTFCLGKEGIVMTHADISSGVKGASL
jgi:hypothetical protein